jgi:hypothetical protein
MTANSNETGQRQLHRNLGVWEAIGISLALMAPSMAASINPQGTATTVGRAVPIAFALAFVGVLRLVCGQHCLGAGPARRDQAGWRTADPRGRAVQPGVRGCGPDVAGGHGRPVTTSR